MADFGGGMGASQFQGGFMPSQGGPSPGGQKGGSGSQQTLRPVTVRMLSDAVAASPGGADPVIDGEPVDHLTMIGKIRSIQPAANFLELRLDDGSGILVVRQWREEEDEAANAQTANLRMGDYVRVYGSLRNLDESQCVQAYKIRAITDYNEVVFHPLEVIFAHQMLEKTRAGIPTSVAAGAAAGPGAANASNGAIGMPAQQQASVMMGSAAPGSLSCVDACNQIFNNDPEAHTDVGISMDGLIKRLTGRFTPQEIMSTVEVLINDAQIYSTIDDRHFKSTNF